MSDEPFDFESLKVYQRALEYIDAETKKQSRMFCTEISKMLSGLMKSL